MTITLCNSHRFTFFLPFHTSPRADQCPIHAPSTCTWAWIRAPATHFLGARILTTLTMSTPPAAFSALSQHLPSLFSVIVLSSQNLFQRGPIWISTIVPYPYVLIKIYVSLCISLANCFSSYFIFFHLVSFFFYFLFSNFRFTFPTHKRPRTSAFGQNTSLRIAYQAQSLRAVHYATYKPNSQSGSL